MRTLVVGDVHGCLIELQELVAKLDLHKDDSLIFLGDLVDRGPHSAATVKYVRSLQDKCSVVLIKGNHEAKHARWHKHVVLGTGHNLKMKAHNEISGIQAGLDDIDRDLLFRESKMWHWTQDKSLCVHGGVCPSTPYLFEKDSHKDVFKTLYFMRFLSAETKKPVGLYQKKPEDFFWANAYDGRFGRIFYGHQPWHTSTEPVIQGQTVGLDLGCVFGGRLCAFIIHDNGNEDFITVRAKEAYSVYFEEIQE